MSGVEAGQASMGRRPPGLPEVGAVIVHFYRERELARLVGNLLEIQGLAEEHIVVIDNGSSPGTLESEISRSGHRPRVLTLPNVGFAAAVNAGCAVLPQSVQWVVMLSHEVILEPQCVLELVKQLEQTPRALVGPVLTLDGSTVWSAGGFLTKVRQLPYHWLQGHQVNEVSTWPIPCAWLDGAVMATSRALLDELDGIDEDYFLYMEDVDLGLRAHRAYAEVLVVPQACAQQSPSPQIEPYIWTRNVFLLFRKHRRPVAWLLWLLSCSAGIIRASLQGKHRSELERRWRGLYAGVRGTTGPPTPR